MPCNPRQDGWLEFYEKESYGTIHLIKDEERAPGSDSGGREMSGIPRNSMIGRLKLFRSSLGELVIALGDELIRIGLRLYDERKEVK